MTLQMRNLEQIQEQPAGSDALRRGGVFVLAACCTLGVVYGIGTLLGSRPDAGEPADPLLALASDERPTPVENIAPREPLDRTTLEFHERIIGNAQADEEASLQEAREEYANLGRVRGQIAQFAPPIPPGLEVAAVATGTAAQVVAEAPADPLLAAALPSLPATPVERASAGSDGEFTLQVASFRHESEAEEFQAALQARGHEAFVIEAEIEGRGLFFRVRVGPFENLGAARRYRRSFEREERMGSYVVRNREFGQESEDPAS